MKYIDAEKLIAEIERQQRRLILLSNTEQVDMRRDCALQNGVYNSILATITSLQQERPEVPNGKFVFPKYLYARTKDNKTIDIAYGPQDLTAVEYVLNDFIEQEQTEVDLDTLVNEAFDKYGSVDGYGQLSVSFNRAELYSFIKKLAKKEE